MSRKQAITERSSASPAGSHSGVETWVALLAIAAAGWWAYGNGFDGVFLFDDHVDIDGNAAIRDLSSPWRVIRDQGQSGVSGRPLVALSYAVNYALHGLELMGWHATNLAIHVLAAFALFGVVKRALLLQGRFERFRGSATSVAFATALVWVVHPLTTGSVMYLGQRVESLMGMLFLVAFYCALRGFEAQRAWPWYMASVLATLASAASKEVAVALPVLVLLFDWLFVLGTLKELWRVRKGFYASLFATWLWIGLLVWTAQGRSESVGFEYEHVGVWAYLKTQAWAVMRYLRLCLWPSPLIFDYGKRPITEVAQWLPHGLCLIALMAGSVLGLARRKPLAFLGAWWFVILAPTSSFLPIVTELIVEHRAYLPLASVVLLVVLGLHTLLARWTAELALIPVAIALAVGLGLLTRARNVDYRDEMHMWADVVEKLPSNDRAHTSYANNWIFVRQREEQLAQQASTQGLVARARAHTEAARKALERAGEHFAEAARLVPEDPDWHTNLGAYYLDTGRTADAIRELELARAGRPTFGTTLQSLGQAYAQNGEVDKAIEAFEAALANGAPNPDWIAGRLAGLRAQRGR